MACMKIIVATPLHARAWGNEQNQLERAGSSGRCAVESASGFVRRMIQTDDAPNRACLRSVFGAPHPKDRDRAECDRELGNYGGSVPSIA